jgi:FKBP-type peptidyl-prolyl cis-trans isomerase
MGDNVVIKGWERGLIDMCKGERRKLIVPSDLGYGPLGSGTNGLIPGGATLLFDVELVELPK